jgi:hypothetical protein
LTVEVANRATLETILRTGTKESLCELRVLDLRNGPEPAPASPLEHTTEDYRNAPSGIGPLAAEWKDKPHRLVYDLCREVERLAAWRPRKRRRPA